MYIYVFSHSTYGRPAAKIGVSKDPSRRRFPQHHLYKLRKTWFLEDRARAFAIENIVRRHFPKRKGLELLHVDADDLILFVDNIISLEVLP